MHSRFGSEFCYECDDKGFGSGCDQLFFFSIITVDWNASEEMGFDFYGFLSEVSRERSENSCCRQLVDKR